MQRRTFAKMALVAAPFASLPLHAKVNSTISGVKVGAQTYSFRDRSLDEAIAALQKVGLGHVELWQGHLEPKGMDREALSKWRASDEALAAAKSARKKFDSAGIQIYAFNYSFRKNNTDEEVARGMEMARAMGTKVITASSTVDQAARLDTLAKKAGVVVAMHNHANLKDPNEFATPESFAKSTEGHPNIKINLDIGHFTAANFDPVEYLQSHHGQIVTLHIKDRKKDGGSNMVFGEGDTPIKEVLQVLRTKKYPIPAMIEYEYKGEDGVAEVQKCFDYIKKALTS